MRSPCRRSKRVGAALLIFSALGPAAETEKVRNEKVIAWEDNLAPGEKIPGSSGKPELLLYLADGKLEVTPGRGRRTVVEAKSGKVNFEQVGIREIRNAAQAQLRILRVDFNTQGSAERWGRTGLSSHYRVLLENDVVRVYDIFIPANSNEPQHTHQNRIVACLSGAELTHLFPDGRTEVSSLKTGEVVWRQGSTHIGQNHSANDFHAIAIEPK